jgi:cytidylate kinase/translation elongation factor EF-1beta
MSEATKIMSIITISRSCYSSGKEIAEKVAVNLGYECIDRNALLDASRQFGISEIKLMKAIHDAPSILDRFTHGKEKYVSYIQAALLKNVQRDNIVYHGLAGHFFLNDISHVLKIRIIADFENRVFNEIQRERVSMEEAHRLLKKDDHERVKWSQYLYGIDTRDSSLYDLVIHLKTISINDAVNIICNTIQMGRFKKTSESQRKLDDLVIASSVKAELVQMIPYSTVTCLNGHVNLHFRVHEDWDENMIDEIEKMMKAVKGVKTINIDMKTL